MITTNPTVLRAYLLGSLAEDEQSVLEQEFFADDSAFERVELAKEELIDEYLNGDLNAAERIQFEKCFLSSDASAQYLELCRTLQVKFSAQRPVATPRRRWFPDFSSIRFARASAGACAALLAVCALVLLRDARQMSDLETRAQRLSADAKGYREQIGQLNYIRPSPPAEPEMIAFVLKPNLRADGAETSLTLNGATVVSLRLQPDIPESFDQFHVSLTAVRGSGNRPEIWSQSWTGHANLVAIPASLLAEGSYLLTLSGSKKSNHPLEVVADFAFNVRR